MNSKILTQVDYIECNNLIGYNSRVDIAPDKLQLENYYFDDREHTHIVFGSYDENDILNACIFSNFSTYDRSWVIDYVIRQSFADIGSIICALNHAVSYAEAAGYYRCNAIYFSKEDIVWERLLHNKTLFSRYDVATEEVIPAYKRSSFKKYWITLQKFVAFPKTQIIKQYSLLEKYRAYTI